MRLPARPARHRSAARRPGHGPPARDADIVIVGGGTAGAVLAARLSEKPSRQVTLLEAGPVHRPARLPYRLASSAVIGTATGHDWGYTASPGGARLPRGKVLGGSSAVNATVAMRALPSDFARWSANGLRGWTFAEVLPSYRRLERADHGSDALRGRAGPVPVHRLEDHELSRAQAGLLEAAAALGHPRTDFNSARPRGASPYPVTAAEGVRINTAMAYLTEEVRARPGLRIEEHALADRVMFDGDRAAAVRLADGRVLPARDIVLCCGTYGSAAVLLRSGVGPADRMRALGIPVVADLPVGTAYQDHPLLYLVHTGWPHRLGRPRSVAGAALWTAGAEATEGELDLHVGVMQPVFPPLVPGLALIVGLTRPHSRGVIELASRDPALAPRIRPRHLSDERDQRRFREGVTLACRLTRTHPLADLLGPRVLPPALVPGAAGGRALEAAVRTFHHPTSSAPMGADEDPAAVVDASGRVRGTRGLRVIDASIFPDVPSAPTNLTVIMAAEHLAGTFR
ncbi:GMC oxidoreductase [Streptomyces sp. TRM 70351]|uniref:GMC family oxidoreductase n=1 Tax=Streptomyces sp. TRM 70351 TaxID=3116552 RepID=UPI002E7B8979|nr:GMC oxidoreductase [Streptomyces sp. TRM 70351]MEE1928893.1 GMC oxidoreductase [Streptomyces sp. TRM 70351]